MSGFVDFNYFGGAVLADESCGSVTFSGSSGEVYTVKVDNDPEFTMSGLQDTCELSEQW